MNHVADQTVAIWNYVLYLTFNMIINVWLLSIWLLKTVEGNNI